MHQLDVWTKFLCLLIVIPVSAFIAPAWLLIAILLHVLLLTVLGKVSLRVFWKQVRLYYIFLTVAVIALSLLFSTGDLICRATGGLLLSARFAALIASGVLFSMTTDPLEIPTGLLRARIPHRYGVVMMVAYRMMPLVSNKVVNVVEVQKARGARFSLSITGIPRLVPELRSLIIPIVYSTLEISIGLSDTLLARGYDPNAPVITVPPTRLHTWDVVMVVISMVFLALAASAHGWSPWL